TRSSSSCRSPSRCSRSTRSSSPRRTRRRSDARMPDHVEIREVGPRDGFQNEPDRITTLDKVRLIERLAASGLKRLEVTSFVRADVIPQLADAVEVLERIEAAGDVSLSGLVPSARGLQ